MQTNKKSFCQLQSPAFPSLGTAWRSPLSQDSPYEQKVVDSLQLYLEDTDKALMKVISTTPEDKISLMVKEILSNSNILSDSDSQQVETHVKKTTKEKYLKFTTVMLDQDSSTNDTTGAADKKSKDKATAQQKAPKPAAIDEKKEAKKNSSPKKIVEKNTNIKATSTDNCEQPPSSKKHAAQPHRQTQKTNFVDYSPAVDVTSQGFIDTGLVKAE